MFFHTLLLTLIFAWACSPSEKQQLIQHAQKYRPDEADQQLIIQEIESKEDHFVQESYSLEVYRPATANRYHSTMVDMWVHPVRETAGYAVDLLASGVPAYQERAFEVIEAVINAQDQDSTRNTYGIWPYNFEEPLDAMNRPDWNWADFIGVQLLEAYMKYYDTIPDALRKWKHLLSMPAVLSSKGT